MRFFPPSCCQDAALSPALLTGSAVFSTVFQTICGPCAAKGSRRLGVSRRAGLPRARLCGTLSGMWKHSLYPCVISCLLALPAAGQTQLGPSISGDARMGLAWSQPDPRFGGRQDGLRLTSRARLRLQFLGETDGGTQFGATIDLDPDTRRPRSRQVHIGR